MKRTKMGMTVTAGPAGGRAGRLAAGLAAGLVAGLAVGVGAVSAMQPQDDPMMGITPEQIAAMLRQAGEPVEEHAWLGTLAGEWEYRARFMMMPGADEDVSTGTMTREVVLDGLGLHDSTDMAFTVMGNTMAVKGMSLMTFNKATREYEQVWIDSLEPYALLLRGTRRDDGTLVMEGSAQTLQGPLTMRQVFTVVSEDETLLEFFSPNPMDGQWIQTGEIRSKRK